MMEYEFEVDDKVRLISEPLESAAQGIPLGSIGAVVKRDYDTWFNCREYLVRFVDKEMWIKYNSNNRVLELEQEGNL